MSKNNILIINSGSSSLKFAVINPKTEEESISGLAERLGSDNAGMKWKINGEKVTQSLGTAAHDEAIEALLGLLHQNDLISTLAAVGHRIVHGGEYFTQSTLVTDEVIKAIEENERLAPLHTPANLKGIYAAQKYFPELPQSVVFDTAFHQTMPAESFLYAIPYKLYKEHGVRRYGAHGTSYRFVAQAAVKTLGLNSEDHCIMVAHLGNGASACAIKNGKSVDTTMGLTPLEGLVMGTRSGDIDPNIFKFMKDTCGYTLEQTTDMLNKQSGLLGLSEMDNDCRTLEDAALAGNEHAQLTMDVFCNVLAKKLAGFVAELGRVDALIFTGGIGENSAFVRENVLRRLAVFGFNIDSELNSAMFAGKSGIITKEGAPALAAVIPTNEELMIARDTQALISK
ncbi:Acetate kinase [invertebrate metagenome]|uniref:Acetate kinase n=1 Tax=invertebrate metagenome TaxID=1711999 RepID=A0A2H9TB10_9ZZZZ